MKPILINILNTDLSVKSRIVIVGDVPEKFRKSLDKCDPDKKIAESIYGNSWRKKLFLGGNEDEPENQITLDDLSIFVEDEKKPEPELPKKISPGGKTTYSYVNVYEYDTILEFKQKLAYIISQPIFKIHMCFTHGGKKHAMMYNLSYKKHIYNPDIRNLKSATEKISEVPIETKFSNFGNAIKIKTYDFVTIMKDLYERFGVYEFDVILFDDFITPDLVSSIKSIKNITQETVLYYSFVMLYFPMFTLNVFSDYINMSNAEFRQNYPDLYPLSDYGKQLEYERDITAKKDEIMHNKKNISDMCKKINKGIESSIIQVFAGYKEDIVIKVRSMFDMVPLTEQIIAASCCVYVENSRYLFRKTYKKHSYIKLIPEPNSIIYRIRYNTQTTESFTITFYKNGNYYISSNFLEENMYNFHDIVSVLAKIVNPFIDKLNSMQRYFLIGNKRLFHMNFMNCKFVDLQTFIVLKEKMDEARYKKFIEIMNTFSQAKIVTLNESGFDYEKYYFNKGVYQLDINRIEKNITTNNYYGFMTNLHEKQVYNNLFRMNRVMTITNRGIDLRIQIKGIQDKEYDVYYSYMLLSLYLLSLEKTVARKVNVEKTDRKIKSLRIYDPELYGFKKLYNTSTPYSKICQKPFQPIILDDDDKRPGRVKFYNFTTKNNIYYYCPNPKYPNLTFIVNKHPKGYCIPCCKKSAITEESIKSDMYKTCLEKYSYNNKREIKSSHYVMNYGRYIDPGRICNLPPYIINSLINSTYTTAEMIPQESNYLIYGVEQTYAGIKNTAILNVILIIFERPVQSIIEEMCREISANKTIFNILLQGKIFEYFHSYKDLISSLKDIFVHREEQFEPIPWNEIFYDILFYYLKINVIEIRDDNPPKESNVDFFYTSFMKNITSKSDILMMKKHIVVINTRNIICPVFQINSFDFFSSNAIEKKIFSPQDMIIDVFSNVADYMHFAKNKDKDILDLDDIYKFNMDSKKYNVKGVFVNKSNFCYMVHIIHDKKNIYVPVNFVYYNISSNFEIYYEPYNRTKHKNEFAILNEFLREYNKFAIIQNKKFNRPHGYKVITVDNWILYDKCIVGFVYKTLNFYVSITPKLAKEVSGAGTFLMKYEVNDVNKCLFEETPPKEDNRTKNIFKNLYNYNLYSLFILEFINYFTNNKNKEIRKYIRKEIESHSPEALTNIYNKMIDYYSGFYDEEGKKPEIKVEIADPRFAKIKIDVDRYNKFRVFLLNDMEKIENQISNYNDGKVTIEKLFEEMNSSAYAFDFEDIHVLKNQEKEKAISKLKSIAKNLFCIRENNNMAYKDFPNVFMSCFGEKISTDYCYKGKLIIEKCKLLSYLEIFYQDIKNPLKEQWLLTFLYIDNVFDFFKFIKRNNETIDVQKLF